MFVEIPQNLILFTIGAFLLGWILSAISARLSARHDAKKRDPRDDRIRSLEAELRVTTTDLTAKLETLEELESELGDAQEGIEKRDNVISHQQGNFEGVKKDLRESVMKTRELRAELSDRATENVKSEAKLREVETELSVAQASTDLIATGVLDYAMVPETEDEASLEEQDDDDQGAEEVSKSAS